MKEKTYKYIADSEWIDDLSEEEKTVLQHTHKIDDEMKKNKRIKTNWLKDD